MYEHLEQHKDYTYAFYNARDFLWTYIEEFAECMLLAVWDNLTLRTVNVGKEKKKMKKILIPAKQFS